MTPKEKAQELYRTYIDYTVGHFNCKQCALIAVDEIKEFMSPMVHSKQAYDYWDEVKQEIEKL